MQKSNECKPLTFIETNPSKHSNRNTFRRVCERERVREWCTKHDETSVNRFYRNANAFSNFGIS